MRLIFLGTRGEIPLRSRWHWRHTSTAIVFRQRRVVIDFGEDWREDVKKLRADALVLTHAHPDHVAGLRDGVACPVYATAQTWTRIASWPIADRRTLRPWKASEISGMMFEAIPVEHSLRAPAVGYRVTAGGTTMFYVPDVAAIPRANRALAGVEVYVGDGARITRPLVKWQGNVATGHTSIARQLEWCRAHGIARAVFTHCGSEIVKGTERAARARIAALGRANTVRTTLAYDGLQLAIGS
jgi:phosphoribosyl 1,2-cyclic phosphodiesterase